MKKRGDGSRPRLQNSCDAGASFELLVKSDQSRFCIAGLGGTFSSDNIAGALREIDVSLRSWPSTQPFRIVNRVSREAQMRHTDIRKKRPRRLPRS